MEVLDDTEFLTGEVITDATTLFARLGGWDCRIDGLASRVA
jgi:hypothetical protein